MSQEEYEQFQLKEMAECEEEIDRFDKVLNYEDAALDEMEERIDNLDSKIQ